MHENDFMKKAWNTESIMKGKRETFEPSNAAHHEN